MRLLKFELWFFVILLIYLVSLGVSEASAQAEASVNDLEQNVFTGFQEDDKKDKDGDPWLGKDKVQHFLASAFLTTAGYFTLNEPFDKSENTSLLFGSSLSLSAGVGKEFYDLRSHKGHASYRDLAADILGIGFAVLIIKVL